MKGRYKPLYFAILLYVFGFQTLAGQNVTIKDTLKMDLIKENIKFDSSFIVEGEILGMDSGSIRISSHAQGLIAYVPFRNGNFFFCGNVKSLEQIRFTVNGDYYDHVFYVEPGKIKIKYVYQSKFTASGTIENDLSNYFQDTLNKKNSERFWELSNRIELALKNEDLQQYLNLIDSLIITEKAFFKTVDEAISQKRFGDYLLAYVNYYYINYGYFMERKSIYDQLPDSIKNSVSGKQALDFFNNTKKKNASQNNVSAYQFTLRDINNNSIALKKFKGKIIVLDFWASWCLPCIKTLPLLKKIQASDVSKNVIYMSVSIDKKEKDWRIKERKIQILWHSLLADEPTIKHYEVNAVPSYIVINKEGKIASKSSSLGNLYTTLKSIKK